MWLYCWLRSLGVVYQWEVRRTWEEQPTLQTEVADHQNCHCMVVINSRLTANWFYNCLYFLFRPYTVPLLHLGQRSTTPTTPLPTSLGFHFCKHSNLKYVNAWFFSSQHLETCRFNILWFIMPSTYKLTWKSWHHLNLLTRAAIFSKPCHHSLLHLEFIHTSISVN